MVSISSFRVQYFVLAVCWGAVIYMLMTFPYQQNECFPPETTKSTIEGLVTPRPTTTYKRPSADIPTVVSPGASAEEPERLPIPPIDEKRVVFLLHLLKTGGTTLSDMFNIMFTEDQIIPGSNRSESLPAKSEAALIARTEQDPNWRVGFGHHPYQLIHNVKFPMYPITFLRDPTLHMRSVFKSDVFAHCKPTTAGVTFDEWIRSDIYQRCSYIQTASLCDGGNHYMGYGGYPDAKDAIVTAKRNLASMPFIGITERWTESICLLYYTFGWTPLPSSKVEAQRMRFDNEVFPESTLQQLRKVSAVEYELFELGERIFNGRVNQMKYELRNNLIPEGRPKPSMFLPECLELLLKD